MRQPASTQWWSATPEQIQNAPCRRTTPFTDEEIERGIQQLIPRLDRRVSKNVFGIQLENESEYLANLLETLLKYRDLFEVLSDASSINPDQKTFRSPCRSVLCAVRDPAIFGPKLGPRLVWMLGRFGFNGSHHAYSNADAWSDSEIDDVLLAANDYPTSVLPVQKANARQLVHFRRGYALGDKNTAANSTIYVFDAWDSQNPQHRRSVIVHEIGHVIGAQHSLDSSVQWLGFSDWSVKGSVSDSLLQKNYRLGRPETAVSQYGQTNPDEDFAESVVSYRYNPSGLQTRSPEKYRFLKEAVFDGLEYTSSAACDPSRATSRQLSLEGDSLIKKALADPDLLQKSIARAQKECGTQIFRQISPTYRLSARDLSSTEACFARALTAVAISQSESVRALAYPELTFQPTLDRLREFEPNWRSVGKIQAHVVDSVRESFAEYLIHLEKKQRHTYPSSPNPQKSKEDFCQSYAENAYQVAAETMTLKFGQDSHFAFENNEKLDGFARQVCLELLQNAPAIFPPTEERIRAAVNRRFEP